MSDENGGPSSQISDEERQQLQYILEEFLTKAHELESEPLSRREVLDSFRQFDRIIEEITLDLDNPVAARKAMNSSGLTEEQIETLRDELGRNRDLDIESVYVVIGPLVLGEWQGAEGEKGYFTASPDGMTSSGMNAFSLRGLTGELEEKLGFKPEAADQLENEHRFDIHRAKQDGIDTDYESVDAGDRGYRVRDPGPPGKQWNPEP